MKPEPDTDAYATVALADGCCCTFVRLNVETGEYSYWVQRTLGFFLAIAVAFAFAFALRVVWCVQVLRLLGWLVYGAAVVVAGVSAGVSAGAGAVRGALLELLDAEQLSQR